LGRGIDLYAISWVTLGKTCWTSDGLICNHDNLKILRLGYNFLLENLIFWENGVMKSASLQTMFSIGFTVSVAGAGVVFATNPAHALSIVTSRTALGGNDFIDWAQLGGDGTQFSGPFNVTSNGGVGATVQAAIYPLITLTEDVSAFSGFTSGDRLLAPSFTNSTPAKAGQGPISIIFANPISSGGLEINSLFDNDNYTAQVEAFDAADNSLGSVSRDGRASFLDRAIFLGVTSDVGISRLVYSLPASANSIPQRLIVNRFDFTRFTPTTTEVPVPPHALATGLTMVLAGLKKLYQKRVAN
jgi:hypothetical protein